MKRISKFLSEAGIASRRGAEDLIAAGRVRVNGAIVSTPVCFVEEKDIVCVNGIVVPASRVRSGGVVYLFHKPAGCICSTRDPEGRRTIYDILPKEYRSLKYIGRLDYNTSGLLLLTNDGDLARELTMPAMGVERVYIAKLGRTMTMDDEFVDRLLRPARKGIKIDGIRYGSMKVERLPNSASDFKITITEGKKNEIRIVFDRIGLPVRKLHRIAYGEFVLGDLGVGQVKIGGCRS